MVGNFCQRDEFRPYYMDHILTGDHDIENVSNTTKWYVINIKRLTLMPVLTL